MKKYIRTKDGKIFDLESKETSSWEYIDNETAINEYGVEGAFYTIYYFDENKGHYSEYDGKGGHSCIFIEEKDILKQADTIDELCDEFVLYDDHFKTYGVFDKKIINFKWIQDHIEIYNFKELTIYGCIWTSKGLIFVSEYNKEKGKMVLI